jgi:hypothetical protein
VVPEFAPNRVGRLERGSTMRWLTTALTALVVVFSAPATATQVARARLPTELTNSEFWNLVEALSEPDGYFSSDNLVSNEDTLQVIIPDLLGGVKPGGVYVGVGPDQNFTYIAAFQPAIAFIPDIRRGNLRTHLMYKALMELSETRADFVARLFSRPRPEGLSRASTATELFEAFEPVSPSQAMYEDTLGRILARLQRTRGFRIEEADRAGLEFIFSRFYAGGPWLQYSSGPAGRTGRYPSFAELQTATDGAGVYRAYLASEDAYGRVRDLHRRNLIVPAVGDFAGSKALRSIGAWIEARGARVSVFYSSNVEQYLFQNRLWLRFAENLASLPTDEAGVFIRSCFNNCVDPRFNSRVVMLVDSLPGLVRDARAGLVSTYYDALARRR